MDNTEQAYVGLGSNLGNPSAQLEAACRALDATPGVRVAKVSSHYRTAPWGRVDQPDFVNAVALLEASLAPEALLAELMRIEAAAGRRRELRWGPRTLDLDLLLYGERRIDTPALQLPHPRLQERAFVLVPLAEIAPALEIPGVGRVDDVLARLDRSSVERLVRDMQSQGEAIHEHD